MFCERLSSLPPFDGPLSTETDRVHFTTRIKQLVTSTSNVPYCGGYYTLID